MARRYTRRYRRGRRYYRRRFPRKRYARGVDRNTFCLAKSENVTYTFDANKSIGLPDKFISFGQYKGTSGASEYQIAIGAMGMEKFVTLSKLYDQVRLKGMSVKISYVAATGLSAQTINIITMIDRCATNNETGTEHNRTTGTETDKNEYLQRIDNAASRKKTSLTGGKTIHYYYYPVSLQEKQFINIDYDYVDDTKRLDELRRLKAMDGLYFNGFNPCIYSYMEKSAATTNSVTTVIVNVEVKWYVEFKNSC